MDVVCLRLVFCCSCQRGFVLLPCCCFLFACLHLLCWRDFFCWHAFCFVGACSFSWRVLFSLGALYFFWRAFVLVARFLLCLMACTSFVIARVFFILERVSYCGAAICFCFAWRFAFGEVFFVGNWRTVATQLAMVFCCFLARCLCFFSWAASLISGTALFLPLADSSMQKLQDAESFCNYTS